MVERGADRKQDQHGVERIGDIGERAVIAAADGVDQRDQEKRDEDNKRDGGYALCNEMTSAVLGRAEAADLAERGAHGGLWLAHDAAPVMLRGSTPGTRPARYQMATASASAASADTSPARGSRRCASNGGVASSQVQCLRELVQVARSDIIEGHCRNKATGGSFYVVEVATRIVICDNCNSVARRSYQL